MTMSDSELKPPIFSEKARRQRMTPAERANESPTSLKLAIAAYCYRCQDDGSGTPHLTKAAVRDCTQQKCELWRHRGWQSTTTGKTSPVPVLISDLSNA